MLRWKPIPECQNYSVSDHGNVMNTATGKLLKPIRNSNGYYKVTLAGKQYDIHRLVA